MFTRRFILSYMYNHFQKIILAKIKMSVNHVLRREGGGAEQKRPQSQLYSPCPSQPKNNFFLKDREKNISNIQIILITFTETYLKKIQNFQNSIIIIKNCRMCQPLNIKI